MKGHIMIKLTLALIIVAILSYFTYAFEPVGYYRDFNHYLQNGNITNWIYNDTFTVDTDIALSNYTGWEVNNQVGTSFRWNTTADSQFYIEADNDYVRSRENNERLAGLDSLDFHMNMINGSSTKRLIVMTDHMYNGVANVAYLRIRYGFNGLNRTGTPADQYQPKPRFVSWSLRMLDIPDINSLSWFDTSYSVPFETVFLNNNNTDHLFNQWIREVTSFRYNPITDKLDASFELFNISNNASIQPYGTHNFSINATVGPTFSANNFTLSLYMQRRDVAIDNIRVFVWDSLTSLTVSNPTSNTSDFFQTGDNFWIAATATSEALTNITYAWLSINNGSWHNLTPTECGAGSCLFNTTHTIDKQTDSYTFKVYANDTFGNVDESSSIVIYNYGHNVTALTYSPLPYNLIEPLVLVPTIDLSYGKDSVTNYTRWYINDVYNATWDNHYSLHQNNFTAGDTVFASWKVYNGYINSSWFNSSSLSMNDSGPPSYINASTDISTNNVQGTVFLEMLDASDIVSVIMQLTDPDSIVQPNLTMSLSEGTARIGNWTRTYTPTKNGVWFAKFYATDASANSGNSSETFLNFTVSSAPPSEEPAGGGGGGGSRQSVDIGLTNLTGFCGDGLCSEGENPNNCWEDCRVNYDTLITCIWDDSIECSWQESWFPTLLVFLIGGTLIFVFLYNEYKKGKKGRRKG